MRSRQYFSLLFTVIVPALCSVSQLYSQVHSSSEAPASASVEVFQKLENRWTAAMDERNQFDLELVLASDFLDISPAGEVTTRNQQIAKALAKNSELVSVEERVGNVRVFGDIALVVGTYREHLRIKNQSEQHEGIFTHVYYRVRNSWTCVSAQRTSNMRPAESAAHGSKGSHGRSQLPPMPLPLPDQDDNKVPDTSAPVPPH